LRDILARAGCPDTAFTIQSIQSNNFSRVERLIAVKKPISRHVVAFSARNPAKNEGFPENALTICD
jgi:hypothetical protein